MTTDIPLVKINYGVKMGSIWYKVPANDKKEIYCEECNKIIYKKGWYPGAGECTSCMLQLCMDCAQWNASGQCIFCQKENKTVKE